MKNLFLFLLLTAGSYGMQAQIQLELQLLADGFSQPVDIANAGDERLFVVEKAGRIRILQKDGQVNPEPFLDIRDRVSSQVEFGLLGLTFHPNYTDNGYFFVNHIDKDGNTVIVRYQVATDDPDRADLNSATTLLSILQPSTIHNGGDLNFGPDGYLYIALGDGGEGGDPHNNGQNRQSLLGKMLRIDVDQGDAYRIPEDNPFVETDETLDEIWALGLRSPWRFSFDRQTGDLWFGDVGEESFEEVNFQPAGSNGGENYGWRCYEGNAVFNSTDCGEAGSYTSPVLAYDSELPLGCSVTGGYVYRGVNYPQLTGKYVYTDFCSGKIWTLERNNSDEWINTEIYEGPNYQYVSFGEDAQGELYLAGIEGGIYEISGLTTPTDEPRLDARLQFRPNPFDRSIWIDGTIAENGNYRMQLLDARGQKIWEFQRRLDGQFQQHLATDELPAGIYLFRLERNGISTVRKIVKQ
ncbi:PQQ-dependent sugar dehydrogenase [Flavilitoribacter nigricans]|nr:PQQ-dependent sugar dehydrogenase [Flavilitoribacter nigricans]